MLRQIGVRLCRLIEQLREQIDLKTFFSDLLLVGIMKRLRSRHRPPARASRLIIIIIKLVFVARRIVHPSNPSQLLLYMSTMERSTPPLPSKTVTYHDKC